MAALAPVAGNLSNACDLAQQLWEVPSTCTPFGPEAACLQAPSRRADMPSMAAQLTCNSGSLSWTMHAASTDLVQYAAATMPIGSLLLPPGFL